MAEAKKMPRTVMREFQAMAAGLHEVIIDDISRGVGKRDAAVPHPVDGTTAEVVVVLIVRSKRKAPPSSNTGGKSPRKTLKAPARKGAPQ